VEVCEGISVGQIWEWQSDFLPCSIDQNSVPSASTLTWFSGPQPVDFHLVISDFLLLTSCLLLPELT
jgi:hypothetical protein